MSNHNEYLPIIIMLFISFIFTLILIFLSLITSNNSPSNENLTIYECGFNPLNTPRLPFSLNFFLIGILFLIFDLEISFIFPWCTTTNEITWTAFLSMGLFLLILTIGFIYEWINNSLEWE